MVNKITLTIIIFMIIANIIGCNNGNKNIGDKNFSGMTKTEDVTLPIIDPLVLKDLESSNNVTVFISLKVSNHTTINEFINSYSDELSNIRIGNSGLWFRADITNQSLNKLKNNPQLKSIAAYRIRTTQ